MRTLAVAALQLRAHDRKAFDSVWSGICEQVLDAARRGARLIVLPEGTIPGYVLGEEPVDARLTEHAIDDLRNLARAEKVVIVCGIARPDDTSLYNSAAVVDTDGTIAGYADKAFLWHFDRRWFSPGERIVPIVTSIGILGVLVCADGRMPAIAGRLVDAGAEILVMPTAWVTSGRNPDALENVQADLLARIRARENAVPFIAANKCGTERSCVAYCGKSQIIDAQGNVLALATQHEPALITAEVTIGVTQAVNEVEGRSADATSACDVTHASSPVRIAIALQDGEYVDAAMQIIEATDAIVPGATQRLRQLDACVPTAVVDDATIADPAGLIPYRRASYQLIVWDVDEYDPAWIEPLARARALELKLYLVVLDRPGGRAFAVDPDGIVLAGTFGDYRVASFLLDPARTSQTLVAPGTDVAEGIEHIQHIIEVETPLVHHKEHR